jgi:ubiquinone/menaquinone biosynthesis C-methylase UbiE
MRRSTIRLPVDTVNGVPLNTLRESGDWEQWDQVWRQLRADDGHQVLYTLNTPNTLFEFWQRGYADDIWHAVETLGQGARFLELGSGRGTTSMYLARWKLDVTLVDLSREGLELACENFKKNGLAQPHTYLADARDTGLPPATFDCIYNIGLLEHFVDPLPVLAESLRLLKPGGYLFMVIVPEGTPWRSLPIRLLFNPLTTVSGGVAALGRRLVQRAQPSANATTAPRRMVRTAYPRAQYIRWMHDLGETNVECVPYNPYFSLYRSAFLEHLITLPLYRAHLGLKRKLGAYPLLEVHSPFASCHLLTCRKRRSS